MSNDKLTFSIDKDLKIELKIHAVKNETTVSKLLNQIIKDYLNENK